MKLLNYSIALSLLLLGSCNKSDDPLASDPNAIILSPSSGSSGDLITIKGKNFGDNAGTVVYFNGADASLISITDTEIVVAVPPNAQSGKVIVHPAITNSTPHTSKDNFIISTTTPKLGGGIRQQAVSFVIGGKAYVALGITENNAKTDFWEYDPSTGVWKQKSSPPGVERLGPFGFAINNKGYLGGGSETDDDFYEYDPLTDAWTKKANIGSVVLNASTFVVNGKGYVVTGGDKYFFTGGKKLLEYNPLTNYWTPKTDFPGDGRVMPISFALNGKGYVGAGCSNNFDAVPLTDFYEYDPINNQWNKRADYPGTAKRYTTSFAIGVKGYTVRGNISSLKGSRESWSYDPSSNVWAKGNDIDGSPRWLSFAFVLNNTAHICGGRDFGNVYDDVREFK